MKKFKLMTGLLLASTLVLTGCNLLGGTSKKNPKKKSSSTSSITTSVNPSSSGSGSSSSGGEETVTVTSITADNPKTSYIVGEEFVKPKVTAQYSDSSLKDVSEYAVFSGYDMSKDGNQEVKVTYEENNVTVETSYTISVAPITVASIAISNQKVKYTVGDEFVKPTVTATYNDKSTKDVSAQATFTGYDMSKSGVQTVTVSFEEDGVKVSKTYDIRVLGLDWTEDEKTFLKENLNNNLLPFTSAIWTNELYEGKVYLLTTDTDQESVVASFEAAQGWEYAGVDSYGDPYYVLAEENVGRVVVNIYVSSGGNTVMCAYFQAKQSKTTDTEWPEAYQAFFSEFFEGGTLPFYQFGKSYQIYEASLLEITLYDFFDEDLREAYGGVLAENGYSPDPEVENKYSKVLEDGVMTITLDYSIDGGNGVFVVFEPELHEATAWPEIEELAAIEDYSGVSVPHFTASKYSWYTRLGYVIISCETTSNLSEQYAQSVAQLGLLYDVETDFSGEAIIGGAAYDWEEKIYIEFETLDGNDDSSDIVPEGFALTVSASAPTSTFVEEWPAEFIAEYLAQYEITENDIPTLAKPAGKDYKVSYLDADAAYEMLYEMLLEEYALFIEWGLMTEEEIAEMASEYAPNYVGVYVRAYDPNGTGVDAYNALFDSTWSKEEETDEDTGEVLYTYWTKGRITVCVYSETGTVVAQIMEPGEEPVPPTPGEPVTVSTTIEAYATTNGWTNATKYSTVVLDDVITATASDGTNNSKYYSSDNSWRFYETESGTLTITAASGYTIESVTLTFTIKDSGTLSYSGSAVSSKTAVEVNNSSAVFTVGGGGKGKVFITAISVTYVAE